jgi:signal transduction histidine kinase
MNRLTHPRLRRAALDWAAPLAILIIGIVNVSRSPHSTAYPGAPAAHIAFLAVAVVTLGLRRRAPLLAPFLTIVVVSVWSGVLWPPHAQGPFEGFVAIVAAAYCVGSLNQGRRLIWGAAAFAGYFAAGQILAHAFGGDDGDFLPLLVWPVIACAAGALINRRTDEAREARQREAFAAHDSQRRMAEAVEQERSRIARELHDVVAHSLSVIVVQAAAERRALAHSAVDMASIEAVLGSVERTGREALVDLRRLLGLLRQVDVPLELSPQPTLEQLDGLVEQARDAGVAVELQVEGERVPVPAGVELTAYRIVQESLTNVLKHAHAHRVVVRLCYRRNELEVSVSDDGSGAPGDAELDGVGAGHGLLGMRERVSIFGGTVAAGAAPGGGWTIRALLPVGSASLEPA